MIKKLKDFYEWGYPYAIPLVAGALLVFSFAPYDIAAMAFLSLTIFLYSLKGQSTKQAAIRGGLFGVGLFGVGASWIYVSIYNYGGESVIISAIITLGFVLILSLFTAGFAWVLNKFWPASNIKRTLLAFPALWAIFEIIRGWVFTGFPWLFVGYSQSDTNLLWLAPIGSVWLISWAVAFNAGVIFEVFKYAGQTQRDRRFVAIIIGCALAIWISTGIVRERPWTSPVAELSVAMVQGNVEQLMRWDPEKANYIASVYHRLTLENLDADVIIWPESAIPTPLPHSAQFFKDMSQIAAQGDSSLVVGVPIQVEGKPQYYNSLISIGQGSGIYYKRHLVPFGEYVPFEGILRGVIAFFDLPMSSFISGHSGSDIKVKGYKVAPAICYEIAYPFTIRSLVKDSQVIITVSNDAWFGSSLGPKQHLQIAQMRAVETGRNVLRTTNNGITALINSTGDIVSRLPQFQEAVLNETFYAMTGKTPWVKFGPWLLFAWLIGMIAASKIPEKKKKRK